MITLRKVVLSVLFAAAIFAGVLFVFSTTSVLETFQVFPHDAGGGFALYLIEVVLAFIAASVGGLLCLHRLSFGRWFPGEKTRL